MKRIIEPQPLEEIKNKTKKMSEKEEYKKQ